MCFLWLRSQGSIYFILYSAKEVVGTDNGMLISHHFFFFFSIIPFSHNEIQALAETVRRKHRTDFCCFLGLEKKQRQTQDYELRA